MCIRDSNSAYLDLLRGYLMEVIGGAASLPPRRGRPAKPFYNFPVLSSAAPKAAPQHPAPGSQLPFAGGNNFRELGGYEADEGKHVKWGQIYRGIPTGPVSYTHLGRDGAHPAFGRSRDGGRPG